jgi:hypothetical protein
MSPSEYAAEELAMWESALREQRAAEDELKQARTAGPRHRVFELRSRIEALRTEADLLLAQAVNVKCTFRDHNMLGVWASTTQSGVAEQGAS